MVLTLSVCRRASELKVNIDRITHVLEGVYSDNSLCQVTHANKRT